MINWTTKLMITTTAKILHSKSLSYSMIELIITKWMNDWMSMLWRWYYEINGWMDLAKWLRKKMLCNNAKNNNWMLLTTMLFQQQIESKAERKNNSNEWMKQDLYFWETNKKFSSFRYMNDTNEDSTTKKKSIPIPSNNKWWLTDWLSNNSQSVINKQFINQNNNKNCRKFDDKHDAKCLLSSFYSAIDWLINWQEKKLNSCFFLFVCFVHLSPENKNIDNLSLVLLFLLATKCSTIIRW